MEQRPGVRNSIKEKFYEVLSAEASFDAHNEFIQSENNNNTLTEGRSLQHAIEILSLLER